MKKLDFHVHISSEITVDESIRNFSDMCERKGYDGVGIMTLWHHSEGYLPSNYNETALAIKRGMPGSYAFAALDCDKNLLEQAKRCMNEGFDGIKLVSGKPSEYRAFGYTYDDSRFDALWDYAQKNQIPLMLHNNDPLIHWDISKMSKRAIEKGWYYDDTVPNQEYFFSVLDNVLDRFPNIRAAIAHFGFYSDNLPRAEKMLEKYPNLMFDITPALIIYDQFSITPKQSEEFFRKYHNRLIYGTDADNNLVGEARAYNDLKTNITDTFLEGKEGLDVEEHKITPIHLEEYMLQNIYYNNAKNFIKQ